MSYAFTSANNDLISYDHWSGLDGATSLTVTFWAKIHASWSTGGGIISQYGTNEGLVIGCGNTKKVSALVREESAGDYLSVNTTYDNQFTTSWRLFGFTWNGATGLGTHWRWTGSTTEDVGNDTNAACTSLGTTTAAFNIGKDQADAYFYGSIAEVSIWIGTVLGVSDFNALYNGGSGGNGKNPLAMTTPPTVYLRLYDNATDSQGVLSLSSNTADVNSGDHPSVDAPPTPSGSKIKWIRR